MMNQPARKTLETDSVPQPFDPTPPDRSSEIRRLLLDIMAQGPWPLEQRINALSILRELSDSEREVIQQIYQLCYEAAEREADEKNMWRYQRLLRSMILQPTAAPAGVHRRPDPLFCLDLRKEFAVEAEESVAPASGRLPEDTHTAKRCSPTYDAVFPACVFVSAFLAFLIAFSSGAVDDFSRVASALLGSPLTASVGLEAAHGPSELQQSDAAAAGEGAKAIPTKEPSVIATNSKEPKDLPKTVDSTMAQQPTAAAIVTPAKASTVAIVSPLAPKPTAPAKASFESIQKGSDEGRANLPARRSLGPSMAVPELEAQLEALKTQSAADAQE